MVSWRAPILQVIFTKASPMWSAIARNNERISALVRPPNGQLAHAVRQLALASQANGPVADSFRQFATFACAARNGDEAPLPEAPRHEQTRVQARANPRKPHPIWELAAQQLRYWIDADGPPQLGDGGQARLIRELDQWLGARGHKFVRSTLQAHVRAAVDHYLAEPPVSPPQPAPDNQ